MLHKQLPFLGSSNRCIRCHRPAQYGQNLINNQQSSQILFHFTKYAPQQHACAHPACSACCAARCCARARTSMLSARCRNSACDTRSTSSSSVSASSPSSSSDQCWSWSNCLHLRPQQPCFSAAQEVSVSKPAASRAAAANTSTGSEATLLGS